MIYCISTFKNKDYNINVYNIIINILKIIICWLTQYNNKIINNNINLFYIIWTKIINIILI